MLFNGQGRPMDVNKPAPTLPASMGGNRTPIVDQSTLESGERQWVEQYHALLMSGGSVATSIPSNLRRISVQEAAAIQTFPRDMPWHGSQSSRYRQIGNAVPPKMSRFAAIGGETVGFTRQSCNLPTPMPSAAQKLCNRQVFPPFARALPPAWGARRFFRRPERVLHEGFSPWFARGSFPRHRVFPQHALHRAAPRVLPRG